MILLLALLGCGPRPPVTALSDPAGPRSDTVVVSRVDEDFRQSCEVNPCRRGVKISLRREDGSSTHWSFALAPPVIQGGMITVMPGETVHVEATLSGHDLTELEAVEVVEHPERTLSLALRQDREGVGMTLEVHQPFDRPLRYRLGMIVLDSDEVYATSSCPARPGVAMIERWSHPIFQLIVSELRLADASDDLSCR